MEYFTRLASSFLAHAVLVRHAEITQKKKKAVLATKISERGIKPAPLATERTSITSQTQRVIHRMDAQQAI